MNYEKRVKAAAEIIFDGDEAAVVLPEVGITASLKPHQFEGLSWLIRRHRQGVNVILGDEMGLGKTLQAISFLSYLKIQQISPGPFLVLCPLSVTDGWTSEIDRFAPELKFLKYIGDKEHRKNLREAIFGHVKEQLLITNAPLLPFDVLLTTYDIALKDQKFLSQIPWHYAVIDEAQRLKNSSSVLYHVIGECFLMPRRLLMTGTPIQNNLTELWALLHFCMPSIFGTLEQFLHTFKEAEYLSLDRSEAETNERFGSLKYVLKAFMLRRTKSELIMRGALTLPSVIEITVMAPMAGLQKTVYTSILRKELSKLLTLSSGATNHPSLQNIVIQLRKACSHPYLFPGIEPEPYEEGEHLVQASGKLMILDQLLKKLHGSGHRVLLFAQMTHTLDILQDFMELRKYSYERLDGSIRAEERFAAIRSFSAQSKESSSNKAEQDGSFVFLISTRAGGVGLNLVAADTVIFFEQDWNPQIDKQALQRAHRIGQMNNVLSINLVTGHTVEEVIMRRAERKLQLCNNVIGDYVTSLREREAAAGVGYQDLRSVIFGLQIFDPLEMNNEILGVPNTSELNNMIEKIIGMRHQQMPGTDDRRLEISSGNLLNGSNIVKEEASASNNFDADLDEASYNAWVEKFKEMSQSSGDLKVELACKRKLPKEKPLNIEASRKKSKEKKLAKWKALGYHTLSVEDPIRPVDSDTITDSGSVNFVYGDCTQPARSFPSEPTVIFSCVDDSGKWGRGGMFDALAKLSANVPEAYERASEFGDLHLGDAHLIRVNDESGSPQPQWVALAVVQSYNPRRKAPRSKPCLTELECCLEKVSFSAAQHSASIHMPRIGYGDGSEWYTVERLLRKYASIYGINIFVYYFRPSSSSSS